MLQLHTRRLLKALFLTLGVIEEYNAEIVEGTLNDIHDKLGLTELEGVKRIAFISPKAFGEALTAIGKRKRRGILLYYSKLSINQAGLQLMR